MKANSDGTYSFEFLKDNWFQIVIEKDSEPIAIISQDDIKTAKGYRAYSVVDTPEVRKWPVAEIKDKHTDCLKSHQ